MDLIYLVLVLAIVGCVLWLITSKIPMDPTMRLVIQIIIVIVLVLYVLRFVPIPNLLPGSR